MTSLIMSLIISLILTSIIEITISLILGVRTKEDLIIVVLANVCTNPVVVYIANITMLLHNNILYNCVIAIMEISAVIVEYLIFNKHLKNYKKSPFVLSLVNNFISFSLGLLM